MTVYNYSGAKFYMNGGTVDAIATTDSLKRGIYSEDGSTVEITGGTILVENTISTSQKSVYGIAGMGDITISGNPTITATGYNAFAINMAYESANFASTVNISDSPIILATASSGYAIALRIHGNSANVASTDVTTTISGGTFDAVSDQRTVNYSRGLSSTNNSGKTILTGGMFSSNGAGIFIDAVSGRLSFGSGKDLLNKDVVVAYGEIVGISAGNGFDFYNGSIYGTNEIPYEGVATPRTFYKVVTEKAENGMNISYLQMDDTEALITEWSIPGAASGTTITLPVSSTGSYIVNWGDGNIETFTNTSLPTHTYKNTEIKTYLIALNGSVNTFGYNSNNLPSATNTYKEYYTFNQYLTALKQWGNLNANQYGFSYCINLKSVSPKVTDSTFSQVTNMNYMFNECTSLETLNLAKWNTSSVTSMSGMFKGCTNLVAILLGTNFDKLNSTEMFTDCNSLSSIITQRETEVMQLGTATGLDSLVNTTLYVLNEDAEEIYEADANYLTVFGADRIKPILEVNGENPITIEADSIYDEDVDEGALVAGLDNTKADIYNELGYSYTTSGLPVDTATAGKKRVVYLLNYTEDTNIEPGMSVAREVEVINTLDDSEEGNVIVSLNPTECVYDGTEKRPEVTVIHKGSVLTKDVDYTVAYRDNVNVGTATVIITGKGSFVGEITTTFNIIENTVNDDDIVVDLVGPTISNIVATFEDTTVTVTAVITDPRINQNLLGSGVNTSETRYAITATNTKPEEDSSDWQSNNELAVIDSEVAYVWIKAVDNVGNVSITEEGTLVELYVPIERLEIVYSPTSFIYDGTAKEFTTLEVKYGEKIYTKDTNYTVEYSNNINAGVNTAVATITGIKGIKGTKEINFTIEKAEASLTVEDVNPILNIGKTQTLNYTYSGDGLVTVTTSSSEIATATVDTENKQVIITAVGSGTATITIAAEEGSNYKAVEGQIRTVKVVESIKSFVTEWTIPAGGATIKLPVPANAVNSYTVDWGDGTSNTYDSTADFPTHTYTNTDAKAYEISITGTLNTFGYNDWQETSGTNYHDMTQYLTGIKQWGELGATSYGFALCTKLSGTIPSPSENSFVNAISFRFTFYTCYNLTGSIPADLFTNATNVADFGSTFNGCTKLSGAIPADLFADTPNVVTFYGMFSYCNGLTSVPAGLFANNVGITSNEQSSGYSQMFYGCVGLRTAVIDSKYVGYQMYHGCNNLTDITITDDVEAIYTPAGENGAFRYTGTSPEILETKLTTTNTIALTYDWAADRRQETNPSWFITEWTFTEDGTEIGLPIPGPSTGTYDFIVDWGDGSAKRVTTTNYAYGYPTHTYASAGTYDIKIIGTLQYFGYERAGAPDATSGYYPMTQYLTGLKQWGETGMKRYSFSNCSKLTGEIPLPTENSFKEVYEFRSTFAKCTSLTCSIPATLFSTATKVNSFENAFYESGVTGSIPVGLFANNTNVKSFKLTFYGCDGLTGAIPASLFAGTPNVTSFYGTFTGCSGLTGSIPAGLFAGTANVDTFHQIFMNCSKLTGSIPAGLFAATPKVTSFEGAFASCKGLEGEIPSNLFTTPGANVKSFAQTFNDCDGLTSIPADLFAANPNVTSFYYTFANNQGITSVPAGLFDNNVGIIANENNSQSFANTFENCSNLTSAVIDSRYIGYKMFYNCNKLTDITIADNVEAIYLPAGTSGAFRYTGTSPEILQTNLTTTNPVALSYDWVSDKRSIDSDAPVVVFTPNGNTTWSKSQSTVVTVTDGYIGLDEDSLKYQWTQSTVAPSETSFTASFTNGDTISKETNSGNNWYLWVLAKDTLGNTAIVNSNAFYLDNEIPTVTVTPSSSVFGSSVTLNLSDNHSGVKGWQITETKTAPTEWNEISAISNTNVSYKATQVGSYFAWVKDALGNVSEAVEFTITAKDISSSEVTTQIVLNPTSYDYDGKSKTPAVTVTVDGKVLASGKDYSVVHDTTADVGIKTVRINGEGNYTGTKTANFTINAVAPEIKLSNKTVTYSGVAEAIDAATVTGVTGGTIPNGTITYTYYTDSECATKTSTTDDSGATVSGGAPVNAGTYYVKATIAAKGNYLAATSNVATITISQKTVSVTWGNTSLSFTGNTQAPEVNDIEGVNGETVKLAVNGGQSTVGGPFTAIASISSVVKSNGTAGKTSNYILENARVEFYITNDNVKLNATLSPTTYVYDGTAKTPTVTVTADVDGTTKTLREDTDYTVTHSTSKDVGTKTVTITGKGDYQGKGTKATFTITAAPLTSISEIADQTYTENAIVPVVTVYSGNTILTKDNDYTLSYSNNVNVGTATVTATGKGNYQGTVSQTFEIRNATMTGVTAEGYTGVYDGEYHGITVSLNGTSEGATIKYGTTDGVYNLTTNPTYKDVNTYTVYYEVTKANYDTVTGSAKVVITAKPVSDITVTLSPTTFVYNASNQGPTTIAVKDGNTDLVKGTDYTVSGVESATDAGTYTITITGTKNYAGTVNKSWEITQAENTLKVTGKTGLSYTGNAQELVTVSDAQGKVYFSTETELTNSNYLTKGSEEIAKGTIAKSYTVYYYTPGNNNYKAASGSVTASIGISGMTGITAQGYTGVYDGAYHGITVTLSETSEGATVRYGTEEGVYNLTSSPTYKDVNTYTVYYEVTKANYDTVTGSAVVKITAKSVSGLTITLNPETFVYNTQTQSPTITVKDGSTELAKETDYTVSGVSSAKDVDIYTITITGNGNYNGTASKNWEITQAENTLKVTGKTGLSYTRSAQELVTVSDAQGKVYFAIGTELTSTNYSNAGSETIPTGTEADTYNVYYYTPGNNNYKAASGNVIVIINTKALTASGMSASLPKTSYDYTGSAITPTVTVKDGTTVLAVGTEYTVAYTKNTDVGTATVTITGQGNYSGEIKLTFTINAVAPKIELSNKTVTYNGTNVSVDEAKVTGTSGGTMPAGTIVYTYYTNANCTTETSTTDNSGATVSGGAPKNVGTYYVKATIDANGNYTAATSEVVTVTINVKPLTITWGETSFGYTGSNQIPTATVQNEITGETVNLTVTGAQSAVGGPYKATATISSVTGGLKSNYSLTNPEINFYITNDNVSLNATLSPTTYVYDGNAKTPTVTVTAVVGGSTKKLTEGTDYTVAHDASKDVGTKTVTITGKGDYAGKGTTATFTITAKELTLTPKAGQSKVYGTSDPTLTYEFSGNVDSSEPGVNGALSRESGEDVGTYKILKPNTLTLADNGTFKASNYTLKFAEGVTFAITQKNIAELALSLAESTYSYDGNAKTPVLNDITYANKKLVSGTDYTIEYENNTKAGQAKAIIKGEGNFTGSKELTFTITAKPVSDITVTLSPTTFVYNASTQGPTTIAVKDGNTDLTSGTDYTISGTTTAENVNTYTITVTGKGNYTGSVDETWTIDQANNTLVVTGKTGLSYTGNPQELVTVANSQGDVYFAIGTELTSTNYTTAGSKTIPTATDANTYTVYYYTPGNNNYKATSGNVEVTIGISGMTGITAQGYTGVYDGAYHGITVSLSGASEGATVKYGTEEGTYNLTTSPTYKDVNTYIVYYEVTKANYDTVTGSAVVRITAKSVSGLTITLNPTSYEFDGNTKTPTLTVKDGNTDLVKGTDYTVSGVESATYASTYTITITGTMNYAGTVNKSWEIAQAENTLKVTGKTGLSYTGNPQELVTVANSQGDVYFAIGTELTSTNYSTAGSKTIPTATDANTYTVYYYTPGNNNYKAASGNVEVTIGISGMTGITAQGYTGVYDGAYHGITVSLSGASEGATVRYGTEEGVYDLTTSPTYKDVNTYTVYYEVTKANYDTVTGSAVVRITAKSVSDLTITLNPETFVYNTQIQSPTLTVKDGSAELVKGTDYTVSGVESATDAGAYTITITGNGNYTGTENRNWTITQTDNTLTVTGKTGLSYTGNSQELVTVANSQGDVYFAIGTELTSTNYSTAGSKIIPTATDANTYTVYYYTPGNNNYKAASGSVEVTIGISGMTGITAQGYTGVYDGEYHGITVTLSETSEGATVRYGTEEGVYNLTSSPTYKDVNTYTVYYEVTKANYDTVTGSAVVRITAKSVSDLTITLNPETFVYNTQIQSPTLTVKDGIVDLTKGTDYTVSGDTSATDAGAYTITITGNGNYTGIENRNWTITQTDNTLTVTGKTGLSYTGNPQELVTVANRQGDVYFAIGTELTSTNYSTAGSKTIPTATDANTYTVYYYTPGNNNYKAASGSVTASIGISGMTGITAQGYTGVYDGGYHGITVTLSGTSEGATIKYGTEEGVYDLTTSPTYKDVNAYTVYYEVTKANYATVTGSAVVRITAKSLSDLTVTMNPTSYVYDGKAKSPTITIKDGDTTLTKDTDYVLSGSLSATNVGTYEITITTQRNYTGTVKKTYTITVATPTITLENKEVTYTGSLINIEEAKVAGVTGGTTPSGTITYTYYTDSACSIKTSTMVGAEVEGGAPKNVGTYYVKATIAADGNYSANTSEAATLKIIAKSLNSSDITAKLGQTSYVYDGTAKEPGVTVVDKTTTVTLNKGTDYLVAYSNNTNAGTDATVTITGMGNYSGTITLKFTITERPQDITLTNYEGTYDGIAHTITISGSDVTGATITYDTDISDGTYDMSTIPTYTNAGTYTVYVKVEKTNTVTFTGSATIEIKVKEVAVSWGNTTLEYTGSSQAPTASANSGVANESIVLTISGAQTDIGDNYKAIAAISRVEGGQGEKANYSLTNTETAFEIITPKDIQFEANFAGMGVGEELSQEYNGAKHEPTVEVRIKGTTTSLTLDKDYSVTYENNVNVGTATVRVTPIKNYAGISEAVITFEITKKDLILTPTTSQSVVYGSAVNIAYTYTGNVTNTAMDPDTLEEPKFTGSLALAIPAGSDITQIGDAGTYVITKGNIALTDNSPFLANNYNLVLSSTTVNYTITPKTISELTVDLKDKTLEYNGKAQTPAVAEITFNGNKLVENTDYTVSYDNNINAGIATATITGNGNYKGSKSVTFTINPKPVNVVWGTTTLYYEEGKSQLPTYSIDSGIAAETIVLTVTGAQTEIGKGYKATATITGVTGGQAEVNNYELGNATTTFEIIIGSDNQFVVNFEELANDGTANVVYSGAKHEPAVNVEVAGTTLELIEGSDYKVEYTNNLNVGTATVTVTGLNDFSTLTQVTTTFEITKKDLIVTPNSNQTAIYGDDFEIKYTYTGNVTNTAMDPDTLEVPGFTGNLELSPVSDDIVGVGEVGTYKIIIGDLALKDNTPFLANNYNLVLNPTEVNFTITKKDITGLADCTLNKTTYVYDGLEKQPDVNMTFEGEKLVKGRDYTLTYIDNIDAGTAKVTVTGIGQYTGTREFTFTISPMEITITWNNTLLSYTGSAQAPTVSDIAGANGEVIKFTVSGAQTNVGTNYTATASIATVVGGRTDKDNYTLTNPTTTFTITSQAVPKAPIINATLSTFGGTTYISGAHTNKSVLIELTTTEEIDVYKYEWSTSSNSGFTAVNLITMGEVGRIRFDSEMNQTVYFRLQDRDGNYSNTSSITINIDKTVPTGSIDILEMYEKDGLKYTNTHIVDIDITASDNKTETSNLDISLINEQDFDWSNSNEDLVWMDYEPTITWELTPGEGWKKVYAIFRDEAGNQSVYLLEVEVN